MKNPTGFLSPPNYLFVVFYCHTSRNKKPFAATNGFTFLNKRLKYANTPGVVLYFNEL